MTELEQIKEKLRKLISKEESARQLGNQAEAEAFASKIQELLLKYALDIEQLKGSNKKTDINKEKVDLEPLMGSHESDWVLMLYRVGARYNFCMVIGPSRRELNYCTLIGEEVHREFTHYFVNQLVSKLRQLSRESFKAYKGPDKRNTYIRSFLKGAVNGIEERLHEEREIAKQQQPQVNALVLNKDVGLQLWMKEHYPPGSLKSGKVSSSSSSAGYAAGLAAGKSVSINKGVSQNRGFGGTKLLS